MRSETTQCVDCGVQFEQMIYVRPDGTDVPYDNRCDDCSGKYERQLKHEAHMREVSQASMERKTEWRTRIVRELGDKFKGATFASFNKAKQPAAFKALSVWDGQSFMLASPPEVYGVGKTHLVAALANQLVETHDAAISVQGQVVRLPRPVIFTTEPILMDRIRATFHDDARETDELIYQELVNVRLLIIDDVGKRVPRDLSFTQQVWYRIIDGRYTGNRPIILTTNMLPSEIEDHIGGASTDRLTEMCGPKGWLVLKGQSYRRQK